MKGSIVIYPYGHLLDVFVIDMPQLPFEKGLAIAITDKRRQGRTPYSWVKHKSPG